VAYRNVAVPWLSGGLVLLGYAAVKWTRTRRARRERNASESESIERASERDAAEPSSTGERRGQRNAALGAAFLGRATEALSPFHIDWPSPPR